MFIYFYGIEIRTVQAINAKFHIDVYHVSGQDLVKFYYQDIYYQDTVYYAYILDSDRSNECFAMNELVFQ